MVSTGSSLSMLQCVDMGTGLDSVAGQQSRHGGGNISQLKQSMTLDLQGNNLAPFLSLSPNSETMKSLLGLSHGMNVSAAALLISPGGSFAANMKIPPHTGTTPQTPMSFLHPKVIPAEAELFALEFENAKGQLFVKRELEEQQLQHVVAMPELLPPTSSTVSGSADMMDISYGGAAAGAASAAASHGFLASMQQQAPPQTPASGTVPLLMQADRGCPSPRGGAPATADNSFYGQPPQSVGSASSSCADNDLYQDAASPAPSSTTSTAPHGAVDGAGTGSNVKIERKRARNRDAARKCRQRKLDRIQHLELKVSDLKENNCKLTQSAFDLRKQVADLKEMILQHVQLGCKLHDPSSAPIS